MPHEADFCGGRLRLSAFLRVVGEGMPPRPTRLKNDHQGKEHGIEVSGADRHGADHHGAYSSNERVDPDHELTFDSPSVDVSIFNAAQPLSSEPEPPVFVSDHLVPPLGVDFGEDVDRRPLEYPQLTHTKQQTAKRVLATMSKLPKKPRNSLSSRRRRQLPVNELTLLRTNSLDGLPQPSVRCP